MALTAHRSINHVDEVMVSEASRRDARAPRDIEVSTFWEEWKELAKEKAELESKFSSYKAVVQKEQADIRKSGDSRKTLSAWLKRKQELENERAGWVARKLEIQTRMTKIRGMAMAGQGLEKMLTQHASPTEMLLQQCLIELRAIRSALDSKKQ